MKKAEMFPSPFPLLYLSLTKKKKESINCGGGRREQKHNFEGKVGKIDDVIQIKLKYHYEQAEKWRQPMSVSVGGR